MHQKLSELVKEAGLSGRTGANLQPLLNGNSNTSQNSEISQVIQQATHQIEQLNTITSTNESSVANNTEALARNTANQSATSGGVVDSLSKAGGGFLGGLLGFLPLISGITSLFGGGQSQPEPLVKYKAPLSANFDLAASQGKLSDAVYDAEGQPRASSITELALGGLQNSRSSTPAPAGELPTGAQNSGGSSPQITVQVQAMDSQSFMDRSQDIALAVRHAMLNMHSVNDVVNDL